MYIPSKLLNNGFHNKNGMHAYIDIDNMNILHN